jgi:hypothetical protein
MILLSALCLFPAMAGPATPATTARALAAAHAEAVRVTLIDPSLVARPVELVRVQTPARNGSPAQCIFLDAKGSRVTIDTTAAFPIAIAPEGWIIADPGDLLSPRIATGAATAPTRSTPAAWIDLNDGQRLVGVLAAPAEDADTQSVRWTHPRLGVQTIPLDRVRRLMLDAPPELREALARNGGAPAQETDVVSLINGDRILGYVDALGADLTIAPEAPAGSPTGGGKPQPVHVALDQVAYASLANPAMRPSGVMLYLADGGVIAADRLDIDAAAGRVTLATRGHDQPPAGPGGSLELSDLRAVALDAARLTSLSSLKLAHHAPTGDRRIAEPPRFLPVLGGGGSLSPLNADDILLPGPMTAEWELPAGATRLAGWITLEPASWSWGDCTVTVTLVEPGRGDAGSPLAAQRLTGRQPIMPVNIQFSAASGSTTRVRISVEAGESGPILDRVRLRRMLVATSPEPTPSR